MPLKPGSGKDVISHNIGELIGSGRKPDQAAAIAYSKARESSKKRFGRIKDSLKKKKETHE